MANSRPSTMANGYATTTMSRQRSQPPNSETNEVTRSCGLKNMLRNGTEFHALTHAWPSSHMTICWTGVFALVLMDGDAGRVPLTPAAVV